MKHRLSTFIAAGNRDDNPDSQALWSELYGPAPADHFLEITERVLLDIDAVCAGAHILAGGELVFDPDNSRLLQVDAHSFMVMDGGILTMVPSSPSVTHELRFINIDESLYTEGGTIDSIDHHLNPGLMVMDATITLQGTTKTGWTRTTAAVATGATTCTVVDATGWRIGDEIVITPTQAANVANNWNNFDRRTLTNVVGNTLTFAACTFPHPANTSPSGTVIFPEVLNLTRNVKITGQDSTHRAQIMMMGDITGSTLEYFEGRYLGPRKLYPAQSPQPMLILGRYALHFHLCGEGTRDINVTGVSMYDLGSRAFVPHGSHGMTFYDCVAWDCFSEAYWWDVAPGLELTDESNDLLWDRCFGGRVRFADSNPGGISNTSFYLSAGVNMTIRNCVAAANPGTTDCSGYHWPEALNTNDHNFWTFEDNDAHNIRRLGIFTWQNDYNPHTITRYRAWNNEQAGVKAGAYLHLYHYIDCELWGHETQRADFDMWAQCAPGSSRIFKIEGGYANKFRISHHNISAGARALVRNCQINQLVLADEGGDPTDTDFVDCGIDVTTDLVIAPLSPGSNVRIQEGALAWLIDDTGTVTSIPVFYP